MWIGKAKVEEVGVVGQEIRLIFRIPADEKAAEEVMACREAKEPIALAVITELAGVAHEKLDVGAIKSRAAQTSYGQALGEWLTGGGPKKA